MPPLPVPKLRTNVATEERGFAIENRNYLKKKLGKQQEKVMIKSNSRANLLTPKKFVSSNLANYVITDPTGSTSTQQIPY